MPYFHGIVLYAREWLRLLTGVKHTPGTSVKEVFTGGPYTPAFLEHFFKEKYRVEVRKVNRKVRDDCYSVPATKRTGLDSGEVLRFSNATDQYTIRIKGASGWLSSFKSIGLVIGNSKKMAKRLVELVRLSCMYLYRDEANALRIQVIDHVALGMPDEYVDGATAISRGVAIQCVKSNTSASRSWKARMIWRIISGELTVVQIRMICKEGLLKGNALILPKRMMKGYDLRTFAPNIKPEVRSTGWQWLTLEPSYGAIPVKSDDLTHAIYRNVKGLYDDDTLLTSLEESLKKFKADLQSGKRSEWMEKLADNADDILHEDAEEKYASDHGLVARIQLAVAQLRKLGVPLLASQTLMFLSVNGLRKQLLGDTREIGKVWKDKKRHWFPVPWSYAAHIYTKEVLELFGFEMPSHAKGFFHEETHSFVVPGAFFKKNFSNHGGPDLDDTVKVHIRRIRMENGRVQRMAFILRNPNDFGEWSMIPVDGIGPVFHNYGEQPPLVELGELTKNVPQFSKLRRQLNIGSLPAITNPRQRGEEFSLEDEAAVRQASQMFPAGTGGTVIPKMIWYAELGTYIPNLVASNEDIIDVLQQGQATEEDVNLIKAWVDQTFMQMRDKLDGKMSPFWYYTRLPKSIGEEMGWEPSSDDNCSWVRLHRDRELMIREYLDEMMKWLNANIVMPEVLANITWTPEELQSSPRELSNLISAFRMSNKSPVPWAETFVSMLKESDEKFGEERTDRKVLRLAYQAIVTKKRDSRNNYDQWLYSFNNKDGDLPYTYYVRALKRIQNGTYNW